jgi:3-oxoacyl-[acyl-carrier-protein] synthase-1
MAPTTILKKDDIVITKIGMVSSIGYDVITACASYRAGIVRSLEFKPSSYHSELIKGHPIELLASGFQGAGRLIRLGVKALKDFLSYGFIWKPSERELSSLGLHLAFSVPMPLDQEEGVTLTTRWQSTDIVEGLQNFCPFHLPSSPEFFHEGHIGGILAIESVVRLLKEGNLNACILGGIGTYFDEERLIYYFEQGRLKSEKNSLGFMPGEAAAFVLIERYDHALELNRNILAKIEGTSTALEEKHRETGENSTGLGLANAITMTLNRLEDRGRFTEMVVGDLNGEPYRSNEWGRAMIRLPSHIRENHIRTWYPAECFGDTESASVFLAICAIVRGFVRGYAKANHVLVFCSGDSPTRGAFYLRKVS